MPSVASLCQIASNIWDAYKRGIEDVGKKSSFLFVDRVRTASDLVLGSPSCGYLPPPDLGFLWELAEQVFSECHDTWVEQLEDMLLDRVGPRFGSIWYLLPLFLKFVAML